MEDVARGLGLAGMSWRLRCAMLHIAGLALSVVCCLGAAEDQGSGTFKVSILPAALPMERVKIEYQVDIQTGLPAQHSRHSSDFLIPVGKAKTLKAIVYCPGYDFVRIDRPSLASSGYAASVTTKRARMIHFLGRILRYDPVSASDPVVRIDYIAGWAMSALGYKIGVVPMFDVAVVPLDLDGTFSVEIPDFTQLPGGCLASDAGFVFQVCSRKSGNVLLRLSPEEKERCNFGLGIKADYERPTIFSVR